MYNNWKNKKHVLTRAESERKDKVTSIRCSENELDKIQKNAKAAGLSVNNFPVTTGANGDKRLTPSMLVDFQNQINYACSVVEQTAPEEVVTMQEEVKKIWQKLM